MKLADIIKEDWDDNKPWAQGDGWDESYFEEKGLMDWFSNVEAFAYEIRNARRGAYGLPGEELVDVVEKLYELAEGLDAMIADISNDAEV